MFEHFNKGENCEEGEMHPVGDFDDRLSLNFYRLLIVHLYVG